MGAAFPVSDVKDFLKKLEHSFAENIMTAVESGFRRDSAVALKRRQVRLIAVLFGRRTLPVVKEQIMPDMDYWNHASGKFVDIFCVGFFVGFTIERALETKAIDSVPQLLGSTLPRISMAQTRLGDLAMPKPNDSQRVH